MKGTGLVFTIPNAWNLIPHAVSAIREKEIACQVSFRKKKKSFFSFHQISAKQGSSSSLMVEARQLWLSSSSRQGIKSRQLPHIFDIKSQIWRHLNRRIIEQQAFYLCCHSNVGHLFDHSATIHVTLQLHTHDRTERLFSEGFQNQMSGWGFEF